MIYPEAPRPIDLAKDVVCGMMVDEKSAKYKTEFGGKTYYFCSPGCMTSFNANPGRYAKL
jgi:YHS domain-containing protein